MEKDKRNRVVIAVVAGLAIGLTLFNQYESSSNVFSPEKWISLNENRGSLVDDLIKTHQLIGFNGAEVIALLGEPTLVEDKELVVGLKTETMKYELGNDNLVGAHRYLYVNLEKDKVVLVYKFHDLQ